MKLLFVSFLLFGITLLFFIAYKRSILHKKFFHFAFRVMGLLVIFEFTLFNFRFYESLFFREVKTNPDAYRIGDGIQKNNDGSYQVIEEKSNFIEVTSFWNHLSNVYLNLSIENSKNKSSTLYITIGYTDAANRKYSYTQERVIPASKNNDGEYLRLHLSGKTSRMKIYVRTDDEKDTFVVNEITFNKTVPFQLSIIRPLLILSIVLVLYIFRPKSSIYRMTLSGEKAKKYIWTTVIFEILFMLLVSQFNGYFAFEQFNSKSDKQRRQYQLLTEAIMHGHPYLEEEPSDILKNLKNPYDKNVRKAAFKDKEEDFIWDTAFYHNKYYVYFGIAPVIFYYLPFYAITGHHLKTVTCINITMVATTIGIFLLLYHLCKKYFSKVSLGVYLAFSLLFIHACGILSIMGRPDHYSLPILMAIMFSVYGLFWWIKAKENNLNSKYLLSGSLCMALVAACRPQLLLTSFFAIPLFWEDVKKRELFSKKSWKKTMLFAAPYIIIALMLMWYNYVRFDSPFNFGANYNLTTNDMTKRGFVLGRIPLGIYYYLFVPFQFILRFPFVNRFGVSTNYLGTTIFEGMSGGFIFVNLLTILGLCIFKFKDTIKEKKLYQLGKYAIIFSLLIIIADTEMAGILPRYICDFGFLVYFATAIVLFHLFHTLEKEKKTIFTKIFFFCFAFGMIYNFLLVLSDDAFMTSSFFFYLRRLFEFWV